MKYAFMSFSTPALNLEDTLAVAKKYGYQGIEPRIDAKHGHGVEVAATAAQRAAIRAASERAGVVICCLATSCHFARPDTHAAQIAAAHERIDLAGDVGCPALRVFGGEFPDSMSRDQAVELQAKGLSAIADHAAERKVTVCFETHDAWCDARHVAKVLAAVNHPAIACNWDIMHPARQAGMTMDAAFEALKPWLRHMHVHDGLRDLMRLVFLPIGIGGIDHRRPIQLVQAAKYAGYISGEWINWEPYDTHLPRELAALKQCEL